MYIHVVNIYEMDTPDPADSFQNSGINDNCCLRNFQFVLNTYFGAFLRLEILHSENWG